MLHNDFLQPLATKYVQSLQAVRTSFESLEFLHNKCHELCVLQGIPVCLLTGSSRCFVAEAIMSSDIGNNCVPWTPWNMQSSSNHHHQKFATQIPKKGAKNTIVTKFPTYINPVRAKGAGA